MPGLFLATHIRAKRALQSDRVRGGLLAALMNTKRDVMRDFESVIATWRHKPRFLSYISYSGGDVRLHIFTLDKPFQYLDRGTRIRYATMAPGFEPKTSPGFIGSRPGKQGLWFVSKNKPHKGIHARQFSLMIRRKNEDKFKRRVYDAIKLGSR